MQYRRCRRPRAPSIVAATEHPRATRCAEPPGPRAARRRTVLAAGAALSLPFGAVRAQAFPSKPITLIVPWPAGGSTDRHHRLLAELAGKHLGQSIVVENKPGGGGTTGPGTMALTARPG